MGSPLLGAWNTWRLEIWDCWTNYHSISENKTATMNYGKK